MIELTRNEILTGNYKYPDKLVKLMHTKHFLARLEERGIGLNCMPTLVRPTKDNICSGKSRDGKRLTSVVVKIPYSHNRLLFLAFNPYDGYVKTLWFKDIRNEDRRRRNS